MPARIDELSRCRAPVLTKFDYASTMVVALGDHPDPPARSGWSLVLFDEKANTILPPKATQSHQLLVMSSLLEKCQPARQTELGSAASRLPTSSGGAT